ncbi:MAG: helix-turn-helix transcriptional regulator [Caulobacteraceae bacterium]|nr:helix-turn-helix transcriptional regulator [Caulobacteraceae bacterium]
MAGRTTTEAANHLRAWREEFGLKQTELAQRMGVHSSVVSELESGRKQLSDKWLRRIAPALGIQPGFLLFDPQDANMEIVRAAMDVDPAQRQHAVEILKTFRRRGG